MLRSLHIESFGLIASADLSFDKGLGAITGPTGAGKSMLLKALGALTGDRVDSSMVPQQGKAVIEALFTLPENFRRYFEALDLDFDKETIIRREFTSTRNRIFVNDTPVRLAELKELGERFLMITSQHQVVELRSESFARDLLDQYAGIGSELEAYRVLFSRWKETSEKLKGKRTALQEAIRDRDYNRFQLEEIDALEARGMDLSEVESAYQMASDRESHLRKLGEVSRLLDCDEGIVAQLGRVELLLSEMGMTEEWDGNLQEALRSVSMKVSDRLYALEENQLDISQLEAVMDELNRIQFKHGVKNYQELLEVKATFSQSVSGLDTLETEVVDMEAELDSLAKELDGLASQLHEVRSKESKGLVDEITEGLSRMGMDSAKVRMDLQRSEDFGPNGATTVSLMACINGGADWQPISKAASGGEKSRILLSMYRAIARRSEQPCVVFDEIDTGISGDVAGLMGEVMKDIGKDMQVLTVTHLPQVAAQADYHFAVRKSTDGGAKLTQITPLDQEARVEEIASLLSRKGISEEALSNARSMLAMS